MITKLSDKDLDASMEYAIILDNKGKFEIHKQEKLAKKNIYKDVKPLLNQLIIELLEQRDGEFKKYNASKKETVEIYLLKSEDHRLILSTVLPIPYVEVVKILFGFLYGLER